MHRVLALSVVLASCGGSKAPPVRAQPGDLVITDVTIVPMDRTGEIAHQSVIVRGEAIFAIADHVDAAGAVVVDGRGKWLMPGLADMHVHTWLERDLTMFVAAGVTTVRNMFGNEQHLAWRKEIADGSRFGPTIVTASPIIDGDPPVWPGSTVITKPEDADAIVARLKADGYDFLKPYAMLSRPVYDALVVAAAHHGMKLEGHVPHAVGLEHVIESGQRTVEHLDGWFQALAVKAEESTPKGSYWKQLAALLPRIDASKIPALAARMKQAGTYNCPTLIVMDRMAALGDLPALEKRVTWLAMIDSQTLAAWNPKSDFRMTNADAEDFVSMREGNVMRAKIVKVLADTGAPMLVGTDTGNPYVLPGEGMHDEIELLVAAGVPRPQVMRTATMDAQKFLGVNAGVVAAGARADLLLVSVDPLTTALPLVPDGVVLRGRWYAKADLEAKLAAATKPAVEGRWTGVPALVPEGDHVVQAHYDIETGGKVVGEERIAVGTVGNAPVIVAQVISDIPGRIETRYRIASSATRVEQITAFGSITIEATADAGKLVATGKSSAGPIALSAPIPKGAFLGGPGIGGSIALAATLDRMKIGDKRTATSLELSTFPTPEIQTGSYDIERKADAGGNRVYAVTVHFGKLAIDTELVLDARGVVSHRYGPPIDLTFVRR